MKGVGYQLLDAVVVTIAKGKKMIDGGDPQAVDVEGLMKESIFGRIPVGICPLHRFVGGD